MSSELKTYLACVAGLLAIAAAVLCFSDPPPKNATTEYVDEQVRHWIQIHKENNH